MAVKAIGGPPKYPVEGGRGAPETPAHAIGFAQGAYLKSLFLTVGAR